MAQIIHFLLSLFCTTLRQRLQVAAIRESRLHSCYINYYHRWRTHRSLDMDAPDGRSFHSVESGNVIEFPAVHGLHYYYLPKAA